MNKSITSIIEKIDNRQKLTSEEKKNYILYSITEHDGGGKMAMFKSISTSALCNTGCSIRSKNDKCICSRCYARQQLKRYRTLAEKMERNTKFYNLYNLTAKDVPYINDTVFRFESFGEIDTKQQLKNYYTIARKNKHCFFVLWTKEYNKIKEYSKGLRKPGNIRIIASEYCINSNINMNQFKYNYPFVDKIFAVYTKDHATENNIAINCTGKCIDCMRCYNKNDHTFVICEYLK